MKKIETAGIVWITGYPNSGKTLIADELNIYLNEKFQLKSIRLDGDLLRLLLDKSEVEKANDRRKLGIVYCNLAQDLARQGFVVIVSAVAMYKEVFDKLEFSDVPATIIFLEVPIETLKERDSNKDIYSDNHFVIMNEIPSELPDSIIKVRNDKETRVEDAVLKIVSFQEKQGESHALIREPFNANNQSLTFGNSNTGITDYWNSYYSQISSNSKPSPFAVKLVTEVIRVEGKKILDFGCGDGRDSFFFASQSRVLGVDISREAISKNLEKKDTNKFENDNLAFKVSESNLGEILSEFTPDVFYARFVLHALTENEEDSIFETLRRGLKPHSLFALECRTTLDPLRRKGVKISKNERIFGHYRRFIDEANLINKLKLNDFRITFHESGFGLSSHGDDDPHVVRIVAEKE